MACCHVGGSEILLSDMCACSWRAALVEGNVYHQNVVATTWSFVRLRMDQWSLEAEVPWQLCVCWHSCCVGTGRCCSRAALSIRTWCCNLFDCNRAAFLSRALVPKGHGRKTGPHMLLTSAPVVRLATGREVHAVNARWCRTVYVARSSSLHARHTVCHRRTPGVDAQDGTKAAPMPVSRY